MPLLFIEKVKFNQNAFASKVKEIAKKYNINPNWLMGVMNSESAGTFSPSKYNEAGSGAVGLIQFMPRTAKYIGTTTDALAKMSNIEQLVWVDKYIAKQLHDFKIAQIKDFDDLYLLVFYPKAIGEPKDWAFPSSIYKQNKGIDIDKDGSITISDFRKWIRKNIPTARLIEFNTRFRYTYYFLFGIVVIAITYFTYKAYKSGII